MPDFMIGNDTLFFGKNHGAFALIPRDDSFNGFLKIFLFDFFVAFTNSQQSAFIDDVGKLCAGSTTGGQGNFAIGEPGPDCPVGWLRQE